jgi:Xaa-Pro aminopeptidase
MDAAGIPAMLVSDPTSVAWLTGFSGTYGRSVVTPSEAIFVTDGRYRVQAAEQVHSMPTLSFSTPTDGDEFLAAEVAKLGVSKLGFEAGSVTFDQYSRWRNKLGVELVPAPDLFGQLRMVKSEAEQNLVREACGIADAAFAHIGRMLKVGITEYDIALDLEFFIRRQGAGIAFPSIVVSGERSARPHGTPSEKKLELGDFVTLDFGARVKGYNSDITRTVVIGEADARHRAVYNQVLAAQLAALEMMKPGVRAADVDIRSRNVMGDDAKYFTHGLGHGLGSVVHDTGRMNATSADVFEPGQIWTVEPGIYIEGFGGVRIEDDVVITETGIDIMTHAPKELTQIPS